MIRTTSRARVAGTAARPPRLFGAAHRASAPSGPLGPSPTPLPGCASSTGVDSRAMRRGNGFPAGAACVS